MRHLDLFSGIGGFALAASWIWGSQHKLVSFCERDEFCQRVLAKHWPTVPCVNDIHAMKGDRSPRANKPEGYSSEEFRPTLAQVVTGQDKPQHGQLNPLFVEWLMGYPEGWSDLEH